MSGNTKIYKDGELIGFRIKSHSFTKEIITYDLLQKTSFIVKNKGVIIDANAGPGINSDIEGNEYYNPTIKLLLQPWNKTPIYFIEKDKEVFDCLNRNIEKLRNKLGREFTTKVCTYHGDCNELMTDASSDIGKEIISKKIKTIILDPCGWSDNQLPLSTIEYLRKQENLDIIITFQLEGIRRSLGLKKKLGYETKSLNVSLPESLLKAVEYLYNSDEKMNSEEIVECYIHLMLEKDWSHIFTRPVLPYYYLIYCTNYEPYAKYINSILHKYDATTGKIVYKKMIGIGEIIKYKNKIGKITKVIYPIVDEIDKFVEINKLENKLNELEDKIAEINSKGGV
ncbi:MAG: three-Cys-motif partner protein TcmP [Actinobacteria bacterium]|nr:three-Cys-motif partner protein TcmP [Actinomycetota bacterium]MBE3114832.1 three-Cys-motif partner protein TcmP [Actinomycetota bacterium]